MPQVLEKDSIAKVIVEISEKRLGVTAVLDAKNTIRWNYYGRRYSKNA